jgi:hypothetical protein
MSMNKTDFELPDLNYFGIRVALIVIKPTIDDMNIGSQTIERNSEKRSKRLAICKVTSLIHRIALSLPNFLCIGRVAFYLEPTFSEIFREYPKPCVEYENLQQLELVHRNLTTFHLTTLNQQIFLPTQRFLSHTQHTTLLAKEMCTPRRMLAYPEYDQRL